MVCLMALLNHILYTECTCHHDNKNVIANIHYMVMKFVECICRNGRMTQWKYDVVARLLRRRYRRRNNVDNMVRMNVGSTSYIYMRNMLNTIRLLDIQIAIHSLVYITRKLTCDLILSTSGS